MFNSILERIIIVLLLGIIVTGTYLSFKANNTLNDMEKMYFDSPTVTINENIV